MDDAAADIGNAAGGMHDGAADIADGAADMGDGAADMADGAGGMGDGAADMADGAAGTIPVFVDAVVGIGIIFGTRGGLGCGGPSDNGLASNSADVGVEFATNN